MFSPPRLLSLGEGAAAAKTCWSRIDPWVSLTKCPGGTLHERRPARAVELGGELRPACFGRGSSDFLGRFGVGLRAPWPMSPRAPSATLPDLVRLDWTTARRRHCSRTNRKPDEPRLPTRRANCLTGTSSE